MEKHTLKAYLVNFWLRENLIAIACKVDLNKSAFVSSCYVWGINKKEEGYLTGSNKYE